jgi:hypothetical protein
MRWRPAVDRIKLVCTDDLGSTWVVAWVPKEKADA